MPAPDDAPHFNGDPAIVPSVDDPEKDAAPADQTIVHLPSKSDPPRTGNLASAPKRSPEQREIDLLFVDEAINAKRWTHQQVADWFSAHRPYKYSRSMVTSDIKVIINRFQEELGTKITERKMKELIQLDKLEREAVEAWERSKQDSLKVVQESGLPPARQMAGQPADSAPIPLKRINTKEHQNGDPRFLQVVLAIKERRSKMLGLDAPTKLEVEDVTDGVLIPFNHLKSAFERRVLREHNVVPKAIDVQSERTG